MGSLVGWDASVLYLMMTSCIFSATVHFHICQSKDGRKIFKQLRMLPSTRNCIVLVGLKVAG